MAEKTFLSPAVSTREIDLSQPTTLTPTGVPAGIVGTARRGPAFVPVTVATFQDFVAKFGNTDGEAFGPLAMHEWMRFQRAGTYVRVLGVGNGKARVTSGKVTNAGFIVGDALPQANGNIGVNTYAHTGMQLGRTYILAAYMKQADGSTVFADAGLNDNNFSAARPIVRGIMMFASGVVPTLNTDITSDNRPLASGVPETAEGIERGTSIGDILTGSGEKQEFIMLLNGHKVSDSYLNVITASFDPDAPNNFRNMFNTDPTKIEESGHYLYQDYQVHKTIAVVTGAGATHFADTRGSGQEDGISGKRYGTCFIMASSGSRNDSSETSSTALGNINLEGFDDRFRTAFSPFVISQKFGGQNQNLFKVHALDDGQAGSDTFKITIENIIGSTNENRTFGSFDLAVRRFDDADRNKEVLEKFSRIDLDPASDRYIARVIGDTHTFYDFDKKAGGQKLVIDGVYPNKSQYIRVETSDKLDNGSIDDSALPVGFRGLHHMVTSGSNDATGFGAVVSGSITGSGESARNFHVSIAHHHTMDEKNIFSGSFRNLVQFPIPMRENLSKGTGQKKTADANLTWGIQFEKKKNLSEPNALDKLDPMIRSYVRYLPHHLESDQNVWAGANEGAQDVAGSILDADRFNNNLFSLERIEVITDANSKPDPQQWAVAAYRRDGTAESTMTDVFGNAGQASRLLNPATDLAHLPSRKYLKFTFPLQGGFDGTNIFNEDKAKFRDNAVRREMDDSSNQGGTSGPTVAALRKAIDVMEEKSDVDIKVLAIPGLRHESITDYAVDSTERRFDALFVMDVEEKDTVSSYVTSSADQVINVSNTVTRFANRNMDSSFAAAYFPDVVITDPSTQTNVQCPPSVAVIGALSYNDSVAHPWYAPAGFTRGALMSVIESQVKLNQANLDELYEVDINPLASFGHTPEVVVFGQKTLLANKSSLDRVNVRRLLIEVRRKVRVVANTLLFEPNRADTLTKFSNAVTPILARIQALQGLERFKVQIDTTTTTQADVENNTIRGKIYLQPTRAVEFISLDFVVTNAGAEI